MQNLLVDVDTKNVEGNPHCFHGPTLLFRRRGSAKSEYFACSACRDRTECSFYLKKVNVNANKQSERAILRRKEINLKVNSKSTKALRKKLKNTIASQRGYCHTCNELFVISQDCHRSCYTINGLSDKQLIHPTEICIPRENTKVEAQYFFSAETTSHILSFFVAMQLNHILCVGTPRIFENIVNKPALGMNALLLDIDPKYHYFYTENQFVWYNMFNNFIMDENGEKVLREFLKNDVTIILDPPFGGRVEPIAATIAKLTTEYNRLNSTNLKELNVVWFFPYFMERHIQDSLPTFRMLDYQVNYENHACFSDKGHRRRKAGSPVRIFTNIPLKLFNLDGVPGYRLCNKCDYWVSVSNVHCDPCNSCTSKNGTSYSHCYKCQKCVKLSYSHCDTCQRCCLTTHKCGEFQPDNTCYHCHQPGHKKSQCPNIAKRKKKTKNVTS